VNKITKNSTIAEIGTIVCQSLKDAGVDCFLSGGAVVSIYTNNEYESHDLDFITFADRKKIKNILQNLGFSQDRSRMFVHDDTIYSVEFPGNAVMIGNKPITEFAEITLGGNSLKLLTPTDCVKDRLAGYIHWSDQQSLFQAVMVAKNQPIHLEKVKVFCIAEGKNDAFEEFLRLIKNA
jgi:hypothetical protein